MSLLDNITSAVNKGAATATRTAEKAKLNSKINEINKRRQQLAAQLGASLYEATAADPAYRAGREGLYESIASCDAEREACRLQIAQLDAQIQNEASLNCPICGALITASDLFCSGCGTSIEQIRDQSQLQGVPVQTDDQPDSFCCSECGAMLSAGDMFCMSCGAPSISNKSSVFDVQETIDRESEALATEEAAALTNNTNANEGV